MSQAKITRSLRRFCSFSPNQASDSYMALQTHEWRLVDFVSTLGYAWLIQKGETLKQIVYVLVVLLLLVSSAGRVQAFT